MAAFNVTNLNDSGGGILRGAINQANLAAGADTIGFDLSLGGQTIGLTSGELGITDSLTILGLTDLGGLPNISIASNGFFRIFNVNDGNLVSNITVNFENLTITGGGRSRGRLGG